MPVPEFILSLRQKVGHDPLWLPGVSGVVVDDDGSLLLGRRADNGLWAVVSGILEPGEDPAQGLVREVHEETGLAVEVVALTAVAPTDEVHYPNGDVTQYLDLCFWCRPVTGEAHAADDESTEVAWFAPDSLPSDLTETSRDRIARTLDFVATTGRGEPVQPWFAR